MQKNSPDESTDTITLEILREALANKEFILFYQPKISMVTGEVYGAEALLRWQKPDGTLVPPFQFIPLAEQSSFIREITLYVFEKLTIDMALITAVNSGLLVSLNASGKDFYDNRFTNVVLKAIRSKFIDPKNLEIEVTETVIMKEAQAKASLFSLANAGVSIAMDDFGEGHSGITTLSKWPFTAIKIDKQLVDGVTTSDKSLEIIQASIRMAHQLNIDVVAEGIEDEHTYKTLQSYGCKAGQGFWMSKPLSLEGFVHYLNTFEKLPAKPVGLLYMAQLDHLQWRKAVIDAALFLNNTDQERTLADVRCCPELDHTKCKLGKWYYDAGLAFRNQEVYKSLAAPHEELHAIGARLLDESLRHCSWAEFSNLTNALSRKSMEVLESLQSMENYLSIKYHTFLPEASVPGMPALSGVPTSKRLC